MHCAANKHGIHPRIGIISSAVIADIPPQPKHENINIARGLLPHATKTEINDVLKHVWSYAGTIAQLQATVIPTFTTRSSDNSMGEQEKPFQPTPKKHPDQPETVADMHVDIDKTTKAFEEQVHASDIAVIQFQPDAFQMGIWQTTGKQEQQAIRGSLGHRG